jgi:transposase
MLDVVYTNPMASLQRHRVRGHTYWRIVESKRINGKPRAIPIMHLGTADQLLERLLNAPRGQLRVQSFQHGDVAALKAAADRLGVVDIINEHVGRSRRGLSVGNTLLLAAINRAVKPRSKMGWAAWARQTSLHRLFPGLKTEKLTSQFFWDQMDCVQLDSLSAIEDDLTRAVVRELDVQLDTLFYDTTNFFTYIASTNLRPKLPQRGASKQKRRDLRLFGLALLVSRDGQIPLCSRVYEGNKADCTLFPDSLGLIRQRLADLSLDIKELTMVYDRGNLSKANQALVDDAPFGYVASLTPAHHRDLMAIPLDRYEPLAGGGPLVGIPAVRMTHEVWGAQRTVVLFISEQLREGQIRGVKQHLTKRLRALADWKARLSSQRSGPRSEESAKKQIDELQRGQHIGEILHIEYHPERDGSDRLDYWVDEEAFERLSTEVFGKRIIVTNRDDWGTEILLAYRGQSHVESVFRQYKDDEHLAVRPQYHWTDQKIQVHAFICLLALLLSRVIEREARKLERREGLSGLLDLLAEIRLAMVLESSGKKGGRPRANWQLEIADKATASLFRALVPNAEPFVYTDQSA